MSEPNKVVGAIHPKASAYADASDFDVRFSHAVIDIHDRGSHVDIEFVADGATERLRAAYVIGCDGGRSTVRKLADIDFVGFTYPERFIKIATPFDFGTVNRNLAIRNFFADPDEWCNVFKVRGEWPSGLWRLIVPIGPEESDKAALAPARIEERLQKFFPKSGRYPVEYVNVYGVSQRVAATFRRGRARRRFRPRQQSDRRHGHERRHPRRDQPRRQARPRAPRRGRREAARPLRAPAPSCGARIRAGPNDRGKQFAHTR
jgi:2-polyprenyl-6-methoxyphenol hydroxylase-like FAD-dependent oxidoreductase